VDGRGVGAVRRPPPFPRINGPGCALRGSSYHNSKDGEDVSIYMARIEGGGLISALERRGEEGWCGV
jgi:hypothetical protein